MDTKEYKGTQTEYTGISWNTKECKGIQSKLKEHNG